MAHCTRWTASSARWSSIVMVACLFSACGTSPETLLVGRWTEVDWRYEKLDPPTSDQTGEVGWLDSIGSPLHAEQRMVRHEAEWWEFREGGELIIHKVDGAREKARWRLRGRGHALSLHSPSASEDELYDVKELSQDELILHYDLGMEVRGVARLHFRRVTDESRLRAAR